MILLFKEQDNVHENGTWKHRKNENDTKLYKKTASIFKENKTFSLSISSTLSRKNSLLVMRIRTKETSCL